jgi:hypothetical protein
MPQVRIVCISDTHGQHAKLGVPAGDVLVHAGDFMAFGDAPKEVVDFNHWLGKQPHRFKVVIAGNHDLMFERHPGAAKELLSNAIWMEVSEAEEFKHLRDENSRLKKLVADLSLDKDMLQSVIRKNSLGS